MEEIGPNGRYSRAFHIAFETFSGVCIETMAEINERASTSSDPPAPVTGTMNPALTTLANDAFHRVGAFLRGQIEGELNNLFSRLIEFVLNASCRF